MLPAKMEKISASAKQKNSESETIGADQASLGNVTSNEVLFSI